MSGNRFHRSYDPTFDVRAAEVSQAATDDREAAREEHRDDHTAKAEHDRAAADREAAREEHRDEHAARVQHDRDLAQHDREAAGREAAREEHRDDHSKPPHEVHTANVQDADLDRHGSLGDHRFHDIATLETHATAGAGPSLDADPHTVGAGAAGGNAAHAPAAPEHPGAIEHAGADVLAATEAGLLAAAAPVAAPVVAVVAAGEAVIDAGKDVYNVASDATDAIGDIFGGGDEHPGQSTFPDDPNAPKPTPEEYAAQREAALEARRAEVREHERLRAVHDGAKEGNVDDAHSDHFSVFQNEHHQLVGNLDDHVVAGAMTGSGLLDVQTGVVGTGAAGALGAPDNVMVPVGELPDHVAIGADPVIGVPTLPVPDHAPADVPFGDDVQLNPQPIPPGLGAHIGEPAPQVADHQAHGQEAGIIIVGGHEAPLLLDHPDAHDIAAHMTPIEHDIASTLTEHSDGPAFHAVDIHDAPVDLGATDGELDS
jgi:hypothetical protein